MKQYSISTLCYLSSDIDPYISSNPFAPLLFSLPFLVVLHFLYFPVSSLTTTFCPFLPSAPLLSKGMITHENTDISIAAVGLVHEMTDVDTILEEEVAMVFVDCLLASQGIFRNFL